MMLGTRIAVMRDGGLEQIGAPLEIFRRPANTFVAGFVGIAGDEPVAVQLVGHLRWRPGNLPGLLDPTRPARRHGPRQRSDHLGIRPHDVLLTAPDRGDVGGLSKSSSRSGRRR